MAHSLFSWQTTIPNGESWSKPITVAAYPGDTVIINPISGGAFFWIKEAKAKYLIIDGFIIDGQNQALHGFKFHGGATHIRVQNTEIKNTKYSGILVTGLGFFNGAHLIPIMNSSTFMSITTERLSRTMDFTLKPVVIWLKTAISIIMPVMGESFYHGNLAGSQIIISHEITPFTIMVPAGQWSLRPILGSGEGNMAYSNIAYGNFAGFCIMMRVTNTKHFSIIFRMKIRIMGFTWAWDNTDKYRWKITRSIKMMDMVFL